MLPPSQSPHELKKIPIPGGSPVYHIGPALSLGPLPSLFYFALSGEESLSLPPFNTPAILLANQPIRIFSMDLPAHGQGFDKMKAMDLWAEEIQEGKSALPSFFEQVLLAMDYLVSQNWIDSQSLGVSGLSRGAFIASHIASREEKVKFILGFAPLTHLSYLKEVPFSLENSLKDQLELEAHIEKLCSKHLRFYIGNRDTRVGTERCFHFIKNLSEAAFHKGIRSPQIELIIYPSIGMKGHGTPPEIFEGGVNWMLKKLIP